MVGVSGTAVVGATVGGMGVDDGISGGTAVFVLGGAGLVFVGGITGVDVGGIWVAVGGSEVLVNTGAGAVGVNTSVGGIYTVGGGTYTVGAGTKGTHSLCPTRMTVEVRQLRAINTRYETPTATPIR
jgi:hypothetical protein